MIWVTGAGGMLGQDLASRLSQANLPFTALTHADLDVTDRLSVMNLARRQPPSCILHCAAYTAVDKAEDEPEEAFRVNEGGTANLADAAAETGADLVYFSTDYVFDGAAGAPYKENDPVGPINVYGASKLAGERAAARAPRHKIVRVSWLCGVHGRNFIESILDAARRLGRLEVATDETGSPTFTFDVAEAIIGMLWSEASGVCHLANRGVCSRREFALEILRQAGLSDIEVAPTTAAAYAAKFGLKARRPAMSALANENATAPGLPPMPHWRESLPEYMRRRARL